MLRASHDHYFLNVSGEFRVFCTAWAMLVRGPMGTSVISPFSSRTFRIRKSTADSSFTVPGTSLIPDSPVRHPRGTLHSCRSPASAVFRFPCIQGYRFFLLHPGSGIHSRSPGLRPHWPLTVVMAVTSSSSFAASANRSASASSIPDRCQ